ncbi:MULTISPECIES: class I SAM-dependent methyltransferase [Streptomyces]|uniref:class I SAM-dependent methyltransferase n=1 Tax=Streptomyces TaxID=1883 RepID=UPI000B450CF6|nr:MULTISPECIES: class I SAM-dependent methyltransferase [Streptomyces]
MESQFDSTAAAYAQSMSALPFREHVEAHSLLTAIGPVAGLSVLDLGCGTGSYTRYFHTAGAGRVVGLDASLSMVESARGEEEGERRGITYVHRDATRPLKDTDADGLTGAFDLVTSVYVLPYAMSEEELTAMCATARRSLSPAGGRFVAMTLNPDFATDPEWYRHYGMRLTTDRPGGEGATVRLTAWINGQTIDVQARRWSAGAHERALRAAGFDSVSWVRPEVSEAGRRSFGDDFWAKYLTCPHALIIDATAEPAPGTDSGSPSGRETD